MKFSDEDYARVKAAVQLAETKTSGEIVPKIVFSSDSYFWVSWMAGAVAILLTLCFGLLYEEFGLWIAFKSLGHWTKPFDLTVPELVSASAFMFLVAFWLSKIPIFKRAWIPLLVKHQQVHKACLASFIELGLTSTLDRTGVLIYVSVFERSVQILADEGIHKKVPKDFWNDQVQMIIAGIHQAKNSSDCVDALVKAIETIGLKMEAAFPRQAHDKNELSDELRV